MSSVPFKRRLLTIDAPVKTLRANERRDTSPARREVLPVPRPPSGSLQTVDANVLVVNASHEMAKEITMQLALVMPGCSIVYAPTIEIARLILSRRRIDLVLSSSVLPDGGIGRLRSTLENLADPPDLVVVGNQYSLRAKLVRELGYECAAVRRFPAEKASPPPAPKSREIEEEIRSLGADLRNDLNNPLQEIVAMVFVAQAGAQTSDVTGSALLAIGKAASSMANVVSKIEDKIRSSVLGSDGTRGGAASVSKH